MLSSAQKEEIKETVISYCSFMATMAAQRGQNERAQYYRDIRAIIQTEIEISEN